MSAAFCLYILCYGLRIRCTTNSRGSTLDSLMRNPGFAAEAIMEKASAVPGFLLHQRGITKQLLEGTDAQFTVDVLIVIAKGTFLDACNLEDFFGCFPVQIVIEHLALGWVSVRIPHRNRL